MGQVYGFESHIKLGKILVNIVCCHDVCLVSASTLPSTPCIVNLVQSGTQYCSETFVSSSGVCWFVLGSRSLHFYLIRGYLHAKKSKCLVKRFECAPATPSARVQIQLDEFYWYFLPSCVYCSQNYRSRF